MTVTVYAGPHTRRACPVSFTIPAEKLLEITGGLPMLRLVPEHGAPIPATVAVDGGSARVLFVLDELEAGESAVFALCTPCAECAAKPRMTAALNGHGVTVTDGKTTLGEYYTGEDIAKPYFGPICERYGAQITRLDFTIKEHPHHRAIWVSHGDVNGVDTWNEPEGTHGYIRNKELSALISGPAAASFTAKNVWTDHGGKPLCGETTRYTCWAGPAGLTLIDIDITLSADYGDVTLGPTKEAGPLAVRMAESIKVQNTGTMVSGCGGVNEDEIWMKRAPWVDYFGTAEGRICGIAIFDSPENKGYPTYWHARNYGLMAVNNFYRGGAETIPAGAQRSWSFRVAAHNGSTESAGIAAKFADYAFPPKAVAAD